MVGDSGSALNSLRCMVATPCVVAVVVIVCGVFILLEDLWKKKDHRIKISRKLYGRDDFVNRKLVPLVLTILTIFITIIAGLFVAVLIWMMTWIIT